ncbi:MAG: cysteinyl-tRNA synthetase [Parcubacteria group bacterium Greene0714_4]|nr:MAG: cysteinyl-tRNA synthetase [Parcubacteria group bacterium Greene0714_4]
MQQVINITDVGHLVTDADEGEDKMEKGARREGKTAHEIALFYEQAFMRDLAALNIHTEDTLFPRASEHIKEQIALIKKLETKGVTYSISDGVYFDTSKIPDYGKLAPRNIVGIKEGARVAKSDEKRNPTDFALWKFSKSDEKRQQEWESPWGKGFPGWHLECSAMSTKYLGETFDIHTGGIDHIQIHHTNEIAQSETATGKLFARFFVHVAFVNVESGKMSKSEDNFVRLQTLIDAGINPLAYRYALLTAHYRSQLQFSFEALHAAESALESLAVYFLPRAKLSSEPDKTYMNTFEEYLADDLNTPKAIALVWDLIKDESIPEPNKIATIAEFDRVLGLGLTERAGELEQAYLKKTIPLESLPENVQKLIAERENAREQKDWKKADMLREEIAQCGYIIKDGEQGPAVEKSD